MTRRVKPNKRVRTNSTSQRSVALHVGRGREHLHFLHVFPIDLAGTKTKSTWTRINHLPKSMLVPPQRDHAGASTLRLIVPRSQTKTTKTTLICLSLLVTWEKKNLKKKRVRRIASQNHRIPRCVPRPKIACARQYGQVFRRSARS